MPSGTKAVGKAQPVCLPRVPVSSRPQSATDEFWLQQGTSGAINAFRQLSYTKHKNGRKQITLPGGKLQPLFKNHSAPAGFGNSITKLQQNEVLPEISGPTADILEEGMKEVLVGELDDLPKLQPTTVRIYLASNEKDMKAEREIIMKKSVPDIQTYCAEYGLHFQLIDMPWAEVANVAANEVHEDEILKCQNLSIGPNFIALIGEMIGALQPPNTVCEDEYNALVTAGMDNNVQNIELLQECYVVDTLAEGSQYVLKDDLDQSKVANLVQVLKRVGHIVDENTDDSSSTVIATLKSGLEKDIMQGVINTKDPRNYCLCFRREWQHMDYNSKDALENYVDVTTGDDGQQVADTDARKTVQNLSNQLMQHLGVGNCRQYFLNHEEYNEGTTTEYEDYLENLSKDFTNDVKHIIKQGLNRQRQGRSLAVYNEALHHAHICNTYLLHFQGQKDLLFTVEKFLKDPRRNFRPFVIHGSVGSGKSAVMAKVASSVKSWFAQECVVVTRFLGTTFNSCSIYQTLVSITQQICCAYGVDLPRTDTEMKTLYDALVTFRKVIETVSDQFAGIRPLVMVLDGIDQLMPIEESMKALWAICQMPTNVHIIMSVVTELGELNLAEMLSSMVTDTDCIQLIESLGQTDVINLIDSLAAEMGKKVTEDFRKNLIETSKLFESLADPLYIYHSVSTTLTNPSDELEAEDASDILAARLEQMEEKYHPSLVKYITSYLTVNPIGIQERELLGLLNSDASLMSSLSQEEDSLVTDSGISTFTWAQIKLDLRSFIRDNIVCGKVVLAWNHRMWFAAVANMYGVIYPGIDESLISTESTTFTLELHKNVTSLYLGDGDESASVVPNLPQPTVKHNLMKLAKLPAHMHVLLPVEGLQKAKNNMFFNLQWLSAKIAAFSVQDVLNDLQSAINLAKQFGDEMELDQPENTVEDLQAMYEFLQLSAEGLQLSPDSLPVEIMARLPGILDKYPALGNLINSVNDFVDSTINPCLMPVYPCLTSPNSPLRHSLHASTHVIGLIQEDTLALLFSQQAGVGIWRLDTGELLHRFPVNAEQSVNGIIPTKSGEYVLIGHYSHLNHVMDLEVYSVATGIPVIKAQFPQKFEIMKLDACDEVLLVSTCMDVAGEDEEPQRCLLGIDIKSKEIAYTIPVTANNVHKHGISELVFFQDSLQVLSVGNKLSKDLACWNLESQDLMWKVDLDHYAQHVNVADDKVVAVSSENGVLTVINSESGEIIVTASEASITGVKDVYISKQSKHLLQGSVAAGLTVMDIETATICKTVNLANFAKAKSGEVTKVTMDPMEQFVFIAYSSGVIDVVSITRGEHVTTLAGHSEGVTSLVCTELDSRLLSASFDGKCCVWNILPVAEGYYQRSGENDPGSWDGIEQFATSDKAGGEATDVNVDTKGPPSHDESIAQMCLMSGKNLVITSSTSRPIKIWDITTGNHTKTLETTENVDLMYSAYKEKLLVAHESVPGSSSVRNLTVWNTETYDKVKMDDVLIYTSCLLPSGDRIFTISPNTEGNREGIMLGVYDLFEMKSVTSLHCNIYGEMNASNLELLGISTVKRPRPTDVASNDDTDLETLYHAVLNYSPNENTSYFFTFIISGDQLSMDHIDPVYINTHSPACTKVLKDGTAASGTLDGTIILWTVDEHDITGYLSDPSMKKKRQKDGLLPSAAHGAKITCMRVSSDYKKLTAVCTDGKAKVWDIVNRVHTNTFSTSTKPLLTCDMSCDGSLVVVGGDDKQITLFSTTSNSKLASFYSYDHIMQVAISADKRSIAAISEKDYSKLILLKTVNITT